MKKLIIIAALLIACPLWAGEKEELQKDIQLYQVQLQNLQLQAKLIEKDYPAIEARLRDAITRLKALEEKKEGKAKNE